MGGAGRVPSALLAIATNHGSSTYHALEAQYPRRMTRGLQTQVAYAWSHSMDNSSTDAGLYWAGAGLNPAQNRASADLHAPHPLATGITDEVPRAPRGGR